MIPLGSHEQTSRPSRKNIPNGQISIITKTCPCNKQRFFELKHLKFSAEKIDIFLIFAQNIDCGYSLEPPRRGGSNEYPQSMFWSKNKKNRYTPANPSFTIQKWGLRGYSLHGHVFLMIASRKQIRNHTIKLKRCK